MMNDEGQSDSCIVPAKSANKGLPAKTAEQMEGRRLVKGNADESPMRRTQGRKEGMKETLRRIRQAVERKPKEKLTSLYHHVYRVENLREAYFSLKKDAAAGIDGETWKHYGEELEGNLENLSGRLRRGAYRAPAVRRVYIPKADGRKRGLGIPALEDKIVQWAVAQILSAIWEPEFKGYSYGFRPGRSAHDALDALAVGIQQRGINWVLDADIRGFFDTISHEWLEKMIEHRVGDGRITALIKKWLRAGVMEEGKLKRREEGTPQGGLVSPVLANIYLHYVFDQWVQQWRKREARGAMIVVRYADDFVVGFEHREEAERFQGELRERMRKFELELHGEKTRLIEFGRHAAGRRRGRGEGKPETFNFLGFTHIGGKTRSGRFTVIRKTMRKRMQAKLKEMKQEFRRRMHTDLREQGEWVSAVLWGHYRYYGVPFNSASLNSFVFHVNELWYKALRRRSQKTRLTWERFTRKVKRWIPAPRICHPYPSQRLSRRLGVIT
jgi:group II intron reverse transcriptase/maturase